MIPLYPGFIAYVTKTANRHESILVSGLLVGLGVLSFMILLGLLFTSLLQVSLTSVIGIISPIAYFLLLVIGVFLTIRIDFSRFIPHFDTPQMSGGIGAFLYGFFFGGIIIPCNPGLIAFFFANLLSEIASSAIMNFLNVVVFGVGMATPLVLLAAISNRYSKYVIQFLKDYARPINICVGVILIVFALYYLLFDFRIYRILL